MRRAADLSRVSTVEVENEWSCISTTLFAFMTFRGMFIASVVNLKLGLRHSRPQEGLRVILEPLFKEQTLMYSYWTTVT